MHYRNGREAKNGDKIMVNGPYGNPVIGILYDATPGNDYCNGRFAVMHPNDTSVNLQECLRLDDVEFALKESRQ
jgi:hypothetical protein